MALMRAWDGFMFAHASLFPLSASNSCRKIRYNVGNPLMEYMKERKGFKG
jgi:hypothetical protein